MKPIKSLLLIGILAAIPTVAPAPAAAQPGGYYGGPQPASTLPGGFHNRQGRLTFGFALGLGGMNDDIGDIECANCSYDPLSLGLSGHIGGFLGPRFALMLELQGNTQQVSMGEFADEDVFLTQTAAMIAGQYWLTPQLWIKGGIGLAHLQLDDAYLIEDIDNGTAIMGAIGFELFSARYMSVDVQGRLLNGAYNGIDQNITAATVGVGINWF